jgi:signal transduction histidine kinase
MIFDRASRSMSFHPRVMRFIEEIESRAYSALQREVPVTQGSPGRRKKVRTRRARPGRMALPERILRVASHELRTPLTPLRLQTRLRREVERLSYLTDNVLDATRIEAGRLELSPSGIELGALLTSASDRACGQSGLPRSAIRIDLGSGSLQGSWDAARVERAFFCLLLNACVFGEGKPVRVFARRWGKQVRVYVQDQGAGIARKDQERVFGAFERAVPDGSSYGGLGLGLYIARAVFKAHGGTLGLKSVVGEGSTFRVELPLVFALRSQDFR